MCGIIMPGTDLFKVDLLSLVALDPPFVILPSGYNRAMPGAWYAGQLKSGHTRMMLLYLPYGKSKNIV
jgi:hypothetical protein